MFLGSIIASLFLVAVMFAVVFLLLRSKNSGVGSAIESGFARARTFMSGLMRSIFSRGRTRQRGGGEEDEYELPSRPAWMTDEEEEVSRQETVRREGGGGGGSE